MLTWHSPDAARVTATAGQSPYMAATGSSMVNSPVPTMAPARKKRAPNRCANCEAGICITRYPQKKDDSSTLWIFFFQSNT